MAKKLNLQQAIRRGMIIITGQPKPEWKKNEERQVQKQIVKRRAHTKRAAKARAKRKK